MQNAKAHSAFCILHFAFSDFAVFLEQLAPLAGQLITPRGVVDMVVALFVAGAMLAAAGPAVAGSTTSTTADCPTASFLRYGYLFYASRSIPASSHSTLSGPLYPMRFRARMIASQFT